MTLWDYVQEVRETGPLVHCYSNTVGANFNANAVIACGGSPMMASEPMEAEELTLLANALAVNIGTLTKDSSAAMKISVRAANSKGIPWVLDPVGVGASELRKAVCKELVQEGKPTCIRGNAGEIAALAGLVLGGGIGACGTRGVDSTVTPEAVAPIGKELAKKVGCIVIISGKVDLVTDGRRIGRIVNGDALMASVTATGCSLTTVVTVFLASAVPKGRDVWWAAIAAMAYFGVAGELAAARVHGRVGAMHQYLLDFLGNMTKEEFSARARPPLDLSLYLVTDPKLLGGRELVQVVREAVESGHVTVVQLREKACDTGEFLERARAVKSICDKHGVPLLINDRVDIALAVDAAGVHVGQSDMPVDVVRRLLGPSKVIGLSIPSEQDIIEAGKVDYVDYYGVGPVYATQTKKTGAALGPEGLARIVEKSNLPVVAIGGLKGGNVRGLKGDGVAVVTALTEAVDIRAAAQELKRNVTQTDS